MSRCFLDTNVLIYSLDQSYPDKRAQAIELLEKLARDRTGVISTQVLQEFFSAATKKLEIEPLIAKDHIRNFQIFDVVQVSPSMVEAAIDRSILSQLSFWDSLIVVAAKVGSCETLYSEDMNDGQVFDGVTLKNPFT